MGDVVKFVSPKLSEIEKTAWYIIPPLGSGQKSMYTEEPTMDLEFSMASSYTIYMLYRVKLNNNAPNNNAPNNNAPNDGRLNNTVNDLCNFEVFSLRPTENIPLSDRIEKPKKSTKDFYHLGIVQHPKATLHLSSPIQETLVAVCDTGVNYNHPALRESIWTNDEEVLDGIDNDGNGYIDDLYGYDFFYNDNMPLDDAGHGTHVAGLISGFEMGAAYGISKVMALKVGGSGGMDFGSIIQCISYATQQGADVINLSLGGSGRNEIVRKVIEVAKEKGVLVVAAAGNGDSRGMGVNNDYSPYYPASYKSSNVISVASTDENGKLTRYSNFGKMSVDIAAPGGYQTKALPVIRQILSAYVRNPEGILLQPLSGTSMAAPLVAGAAAVLLSKYPEIPPEELIQILKKTGSTSEALVGKIESAAVLDIHAALTSIE